MWNGDLTRETLCDSEPSHGSRTKLLLSEVAPPRQLWALWDSSSNSVSQSPPPQARYYPIMADVGGVTAEQGFSSRRDSHVWYLPMD